MNILLIGPQASGKGTQAEKLVEKFSLAYVEMGALLRKIAKEETPLGYKVNETINIEGKLVSDEIIFKVINDYLGKIGRFDGIVFDGFPRTLSQAEYFGGYLQKKGKKFDVVVFLTLPREVTFKRLIGRRICPKCDSTYNVLTKPPKKEGICDSCGSKLITRADETPEKIEARLNEFENQTKPLIDLYKKIGILEEVNGNSPIEVIFGEILARLKKRGLVE